MIHRPYIPAPSTHKMTKPLYPSLGICLNAARSCVRVVEAQTKRGYVENGLLYVRVPSADVG